MKTEKRVFRIVTNYLFDAQKVLIGNELNTAKIMDTREVCEVFVPHEDLNETVFNIMKDFKERGKTKAQLDVMEAMHVSESGDMTNVVYFMTDFERYWREANAEILDINA